MPSRRAARVPVGHRSLRLRAIVHLVKLPFLPLWCPQMEGLHEHARPDTAGALVDEWRSLHFDIDVIDKCNLQCPTCFRGTGAQNTQAAMPLDKFRAIVAEAVRGGLSQYLPDQLDLGVPIEEPRRVRARREGISGRLLDLVQSIVAAGALPAIDRGGARQRHRHPVHFGIGLHATCLRDQPQEGPRRLDQGEPRRHRAFAARGSGADQRVDPLFGMALQHARKAPWEELAATYRIGFDAVPAHGDPLQPLPKQYAEYIRRTLANVPPAAAELTVPDKVCGLVMDRAAIDAKGDAYLCCAYPNTPELRIGAYTEMTEAEFLLKRQAHPFCTACPIPPRHATERDRERFRQALASHIGSDAASG